MLARAVLIRVACSNKQSLQQSFPWSVTQLFAAVGLLMVLVVWLRRYAAHAARAIDIAESIVNAASLHFGEVTEPCGM